MFLIEVPDGERAGPVFQHVEPPSRPTSPPAAGLGWK
jgi:hypothetical protein